MNIIEFTVLFVILLLAGLPIAFVMAISATSYLLFSGNTVFLLMIPQRMFEGIDVFVLMSIPFFMLAGEIMNKAGMSDTLVRFSNLLIGRVRGGLAQVNVLASILFAGITGVAVGDVAALGKVFIPSMEKEGYSRDFAAAVTAASSLIGPIIPPSTIMVLYAAVMDVSVGAMFAAGIIPGLIVGLADMLVVKVVSERRRYPKREVRASMGQIVTEGRRAIFAVIMPALIVGGIVFGVFTPTEAAAAAVIYALVVGFLIFGSLKLVHLPPILTSATKDSARLLFILGCASIVSWVFGIENVPNIVRGWFSHLPDNFFVTVLAINLFLIVAGMWLEAGINIILFVPIFAPIAYAAGIDPVQFGVMVIINCMIGLCTPPVGNVLFAIKSIADIDIFKITRELLPFLLINFFVALLIAFVPDLTLWIPRQIGLVQ